MRPLYHQGRYVIISPDEARVCPLESNPVTVRTVPPPLPNQPVLILSGVRGDTRRYRTLHLYEQLRLAGADARLSHLTDPRLPALLGSAGVVILHRVAYDGYVARLLEPLRQRQALVILDADDFLYDPDMMRWIDSPDFQDPVRAALYRAEMLRHRAMLDHCDAVTASTEALAEMLRPFGKPVTIHRNAYSLEMLALSQAALRQEAVRQEAAQHADTPPARVVIGYASGTRTHDQDFAMIRPAVEAVLRRFPHAELWLTGDLDSGADWGELRAQLRVFPLVAWRALPARLAQFDINLAPLLPESPFNQAKSEIKWMEAALVGVPTIASPTDAYRRAITPGVDGFLAHDPAQWQEILTQLVIDSPLRRQAGQAAAQTVQQNYAPGLRGAQMLTVLDDLLAQRGHLPLTRAAPSPAQPPAGYLTPADEAHPTLRDLAVYAVRHRGLATLAGQVWVYFRRKAAPLFPYRKPTAQP